MAISKISTDNNATELAGKVNEIIDSVNAGSGGSPSGEVNTAFTRNRNRGSVLFSQAKYYYMSSAKMYRLPQFLVVTDNHESDGAISNAVNMANGFPSIMGIVQLGDLANTYDGYHTTAMNIFKTCTKPVYSVIGNHDAGNARCLHHCADSSQMYNSYIKPMVDKGWLASGEYVVGKAYWYHDITYYDVSSMSERKLRLIGINEYDYPSDDVADFDTEYWEPIAYNSSYNNFAASTAYNAGDCINIDGYTQYSFRCVKACTTPALTSDGNAPKYNYARGNAYISQAQAEWLVNTLLSTPQNASVVVLMHQTMDGGGTFKTGMTFCANSPYSNRGSYQSVSPVYELLSAFIAGSNGTLTVNSTSTYLPSYNLTYNFGSKASGVVVCPSLNGHTHADEIWSKGSIVQISSICTGGSGAGGPDIERGVPVPFQGFITDDCVNVVTFDPTNKVVKLCKLGATYTVDGYERDQEEFNWETLATPVYGDKQVKSKIDELET